MKLKMLSATFVLFASTACGSSGSNGATEADAGNGGGGGGGGDACHAADAPTYANFGQQFFDSYCNGCHAANSTNRMNAPLSYTYDNVDQIRTNSPAIKGVAVQSQLMPVSGPMPTDADRMKLGEWLDCGAP